MFGINMSNQIQDNLASEIFARAEQSRVNAISASEQQVEVAVQLGYDRKLAIALFAVEGSFIAAWKVCRDETVVNTMRDNVYRSLGYIH